ncbi:hypothetical protein PR048_002790 [Dryococelus australis]|uniref:FHA domain-containing protein n=1 Tax=Dryococelus australis TaxID=614101 RepID=A0ABQ9IMM1_9NEOP|nr:hypothetical protein PR048_002790 [Dryococelus australis]
MVGGRGRNSVSSVSADTRRQPLRQDLLCDDLAQQGFAVATRIVLCCPAGLEIKIKFISNRRNWRFEISTRDQQPSSTNFYLDHSETHAYYHDVICYEPIAKFVAYLISISHFGTKINELEIQNHEISLLQLIYIGTKIKLYPGSELGSFDLGSRKIVQSRRNRIRLERGSQNQSNDTHKTPYDRVKRCRERKKKKTLRSPSASTKLNTILAYTRQKAKSKYRNRIGLESAYQMQSSDTHKTPYDRVKRCRERKINSNYSERVNGASVCARHGGHAFRNGETLVRQSVTWKRCWQTPRELGCSGRLTLRLLHDQAWCASGKYANYTMPRREYGAAPELRGGGGEIPERTRRPTTSSGTNPVTWAGIEPCSPLWEASVLIAQPQWPHVDSRTEGARHSNVCVFEVWKPWSNKGDTSVVNQTSPSLSLRKRYRLSCSLPVGKALTSRGRDRVRNVMIERTTTNTPLRPTSGRLLAAWSARKKNRRRRGKTVRSPSSLHLYNSPILPSPLHPYYFFNLRKDGRSAPRVEKEGKEERRRLHACAVDVRRAASLSARLDSPSEFRSLLRD